VALESGYNEKLWGTPLSLFSKLIDTLAPAGTDIVLVLKTMFWAIRSTKIVFPEGTLGVAVVEGNFDVEVVTGVEDVVMDSEGDVGVTDVVREGEVVVGVTVGEGVMPPEHAVNPATNITVAARVIIRMLAKIFI
jgi:hypothetical protein